MDQSITPSGEPERWLPAVGWEGLYEVSGLGRVRSLPRLGTYGKILKPQGGARHRRRYLTVGLTRDGKTSSVSVHVLVARAFLGPVPTGLEVCHGPGGSLDNRAANLSYGTHAKNAGPDKHRDGTMPIGIQAHSAKLNDNIVSGCRIRAAAGESFTSLAREFGVIPKTMRLAVLGQTWKHVPFPDAADPAA